jgi:O-antigen/teichoic acid export membrane protein
LKQLTKYISAVNKALIFTYGVQAYVVLVSIVFLPAYMGVLGEEQYGLVGFYILLQGVIQFLDAGLSGSVTRHAAATKNSYKAYRQFLRNLKYVLGFFIFIAFSISFIGFFKSQFIANEWLKSNLDGVLLETSIIFIVVAFSVRYLSGPFRSGLVGLEKHFQIGIINFLSATLRFPGGLFVLSLYDYELIVFFVFQSVVSAFELLILASLFWKGSQEISSKKDLSDSCTRVSLKEMIFFSGQLSLLGVAWGFISHYDKILLSSAIPLSEFAYYSLAASAASVIMFLSLPLSQFLMPRLTVLFQDKDYQSFVNVYTKSIVFVSSLLLTLGVFIWIYSYEILLVWTGNSEVAESSNFYFSWIALGNVFVVMSTFSYLLQYSMGSLLRHVKVYVLYSLLLIPIIYAVIDEWGARGAALFWFIQNFLFFIVWSAIVHTHFFKGIISFSVILIILPVTLFNLLYFKMFDLLIDSIHLDSNLALFVFLFMIGLSSWFLIVYCIYRYRDSLMIYIKEDINFNMQNII